jgi:hypothetical protein
MVTKLAHVLLLICVAALVGLAGCGGDDDSGGGGNPLGLT